MAAQGLTKSMLALPQQGAGTLPSKPMVDPAFKRVLMYLLIGTKGGDNRTRIIQLLRMEPLNVNKIGERLELDYKTVQHHLKVLEQNSIVTSSPKGSYGALFFLTPYVEKNLPVFEEIWAKFGKRYITK
jgi:DNA-binding transcriptional ArsR family regulator